MAHKSGFSRWGRSGQSQRLKPSVFCAMGGIAEAMP